MYIFCRFIRVSCLFILFNSIARHCVSTCELLLFIHSFICVRSMAGLYLYTYDYIQCTRIRKRIFFVRQHLVFHWKNVKQNFFSHWQSSVAVSHAICVCVCVRSTDSYYLIVIKNLYVKMETKKTKKKREKERDRMVSAN